MGEVPLEGRATLPFKPGAILNEEGTQLNPDIVLEAPAPQVSEEDQAAKDAAAAAKTPEPANTPKACPRCGHNLAQAVGIKPSESDKDNWLRVMLLTDDEAAKVRAELEDKQ